MSTIHDALSRAQKKNDSLSSPIPGMPGSGADASRRKRRKSVWLLAGLVLLFVVGYSGYMLAGLHNRDGRGAAELSCKAAPNADSNRLANSAAAPTPRDRHAGAGEKPASEKGPGPMARVSPSKEPASIAPPGQTPAPPESQEAPKALIPENQAADAKPSKFHEPVFQPPRTRRRPEERRPRRPPPANAWTMAKADMKEMGLAPADEAPPDALEEKPLEEDLPAEAPDPDSPFQPDPKMAQSWHEKGLERQLAGDVDQARRFYTLSLKADPSNAPSLNNLAVLDMEIGQYALAGEGFEQAMMADPEYVDPCYNLACLFARQGKKEQALSYFQMAVGMDKNAASWARNDQDLAVLNDMPDFVRLTNSAAQ